MDFLQFGFSTRLPLILQTEASECGLACLAMVAGFHGHSVSLAELRNRFPGSLKGSTLAAIADQSEALGLVPRGLKLDIGELVQLQAPAILHWDMNHFVVLRKAANGRIQIHDPATGEMTLAAEQCSSHFTGVALELTPGFDFKRKTARSPMSLAQIMGKVRGLTPALSQLFLLALAIEALSLLLPILTQWITDEAVLGADRSLLTILALGSLAVGLISIAVGAMRSWVSLYVTTHFTLQWMTNVMARMLRLPVDFFERRHLGDVVSRFSSVGGITQTLTTSGVELVLDIVIACGGLAMMLIYSPLLALIPIASALLYAAIRWGRINAMRVMSSGYYAKQAREQSFFLETVRGVRAIKLLNRETERRVAWTRLWADSTNAHLKVLRLNLLLGTGWSILSTIERVGLLWLGGTLVIDHRLSLGMLFAFLAYADQFSSKTNAAVERAADLSLLGVQSERLADIVLAKPESDGRGALTQLRDASLVLRRITFRYGPEEDAVLSNVTLQVRDGECLALTGASGAGKSTCMKLMLGILQPTSGHVEIGGLRLDHLGHRAYRDVFAAVLQDDQLFAGTILDNICFHDERSDISFAMECAGKARIHDEIERMPMGYHTLVGDMGTALSGGQKQRLLLARALYKRPRILFLDEATSHLDLDNERQINEAIAALQVTRILIAHRPQTIAIADRVVRVGGGRIVELSGSDAHVPEGHLTAIV